MSRTSSSLEGKTALITGSSKGIGWGIAQSLAAHGANIALNGSSDPSLSADKVNELVTKYQVQADYFQADMQSAEEIRSLVDRVRAQLGGPDILVNNAGVQHVCNVEEFPPEKWDQLIAIHLTACFHLVQATLPQMREKGWGRIIFISSVHGKVVSVNKCAYNAAKHGQIGLAKTIAMESAKTGVTCNSICPGYVRTELIEKQLEARAAAGNITVEEAKSNMLSEKVPQGDFVQDSAIGEMAAHLCQEASRNITGTEIMIDGGWTAV